MMEPATLVCARDLIAYDEPSRYSNSATVLSSVISTNQIKFISDIPNNVSSVLHEVVEQISEIMFTDLIF